MWSELSSSVYHYAAQIPVSRRTRTLLMSRLDNLLERVRLNAHQNQKLGLRRCRDCDEDVRPSVGQIPWDDVLVICIDHKLKDWQIPGPPVFEGSRRDCGSEPELSCPH